MLQTDKLMMLIRRLRRTLGGKEEVAMREEGKDGEGKVDE